MAKGWNKLSDDLAEGLLLPQPSLWSEERPCPEPVARVELALLAARGEVERWTSRRLAERWGCSRRTALRVIDEVAKDAVVQAYPWAIHFWATDRSTSWATSFEQAWALTHGNEPLPIHFRSTSDPLPILRARSMSSDLRSQITEGERPPLQNEAQPEEESEKVGVAQNVQGATPQGTSPFFPGAGRPKPVRARSGENLTDFGTRKPGQPSGQAEKPPPHVVMREGGYPVKEADGWYEVYFIGGKECRRYCREDGL